MKKVIIISAIILFSLFILTTISSITDESDKHIIYLVDGSTIETDEFWEVDDEIFYEQDDELYSVSEDEVERIGKPGFLYLIRHLPSGDQFIWIRRLFLLAILGGAIYGIINFLKKKRGIGPRKIENEDLFDQEKKEFNDREKIVNFFLNLFKIQLDVSKEAEAKFLPVTSKSTGSNYVYELRVKNNGDFTSRRMTIGALAVESGSKSKCFDVTYDEHLVVKIPPAPIEDFETYLENIKDENRIVERLAPKQCIIPRVSVVLKKIPSVFEGMGWSKDEFEEKSIERLKKFDKYHKYLMIDKSFIFFMDLSKYYFLGHIVREIHELENKIHAEITGHAGIIWEPDGFERRYNNENTAVCKGTREVFDKFEKEVKNLLPESERYQIQGWFLTYLGGQDVPANEKGLTRDSIFALNTLLKKIFEENIKAIGGYRDAIKDYIRRTSFLQHKAQITAILSNLLELLAWLGDKKVAMRDLKPDNLLVAGDPSNYPNFLASPSEFEIGLIDVETAVIFDGLEKGSIEQPMLAGTPLYATPSHLFNNEILKKAFNDLSSIFHYQDWYATIAMIYNVITGESLFGQTAKQLSTIRKAMQDAISKKQDLLSVFKDVSRIFWESAKSEFETKVNQKAKMMNAAEVVIPVNATEMLKTEVSREKHKIDKEIERIVGSQKIFASENNRKLLVESSHVKIQQFREKIDKGESSLISQLADKEKTLKLLKDIGELKLRKETFAQMEDFLGSEKPKLTAYKLAEFMFGIVSKAMYLEQWDTRPGKVVIDEGPEDDTSTIEATI